MLIVKFLSRGIFFFVVSTIGACSTNDGVANYNNKLTGALENDVVPKNNSQFYYEHFLKRLDAVRNVRTPEEREKEEELERRYESGEVSLPESVFRLGVSLVNVAVFIPPLIAKDLVVGTASAISPAVYAAGSVIGGSERESKFYGNWCGPKYPSDENYRKNTVFDKNTKTLFVNPIMAPIDVVDYHCALHDLCYEEAEQYPGEYKALYRRSCDLSATCMLSDFTGHLTISETAGSVIVRGWMSSETVYRRDGELVNSCLRGEYHKLPYKVVPWRQ
jgi:hypothetical protein